MATEDDAPWARVAYTLEDAVSGPLTCVEATRCGTPEEPTGVLSRWCADPAPDAVADVVVESDVTAPPQEERERAVRAVRAWLSHARATLGDFSREGRERDLRVEPDAVARVPDALVLDGVTLPGTVARTGAVTARVVDRGDHVLAVVHRTAVPAPIRLTRGMPTIARAEM